MRFPRTAPPARRGTDPKRNEKFECGFLQQRVRNELFRRWASMDRLQIASIPAGFLMITALLLLVGCAPATERQVRLAGSERRARRPTRSQCRTLPKPALSPPTARFCRCAN